MNIKQLIYILYFFFNFHIIYSLGLKNYLFYTYENIIDYIKSNSRYSRSDVHVYDKTKTLNKNDVLKIKNNFYCRYYCKNK